MSMTPDKRKVLQPSLFISVLVRECHRMASRRIYWVAVVILPLFLLFFMSTIFGTGEMVRIPIAVVDADNTATSRSVARNVSAVPTFDVVAHYANEVDARRAVQRKEIYGYLSIPYGFEVDMQLGTDAVLSYYYHYALLAVGGEVMSAFETALIPVRMAPIVMSAVALGGGEESIQTFLLPMMADDHTLYNPSLNYAVYLSLPIYFIMFQILVLLVTLYALGSETKYGTSEEWLQTADGNILIALGGKMLPYTLAFVVEAFFACYVFFDVVGIPIEGNLRVLLLVTLFFVLSTQSLSVLLFSLFPAFSIVISVVSMVGSLGATLSGLTFPLLAMNAPVRYVAMLFPVRHFTEAMQVIVYYGGSFADCWYSLAVFCLYPLAMILLLPRLLKLMKRHCYDTLE